jgi:hypothetical protein
MRESDFELVDLSQTKKASEFQGLICFLVVRSTEVILVDQALSKTERSN